ncbi:MAG: hypothetical protein QW087_07770 [Methanomassiliicoccales archaeon]
MDVFDAVLVAVYAAGGNITGRTAIQKMLYFAKERGLVKTTYIPHYYGPYSAEVADVVQELVCMGFLHEEVEADENADPFLPEGWRRYAYRLTPDAEKVIEEIRDENGGEFDKLSMLVKSWKNCAGLNAKILSCAAKVHYICSKKKKSVTAEDIMEEARYFGWELSQDQVHKAVKLLESISSQSG